MKLKTLIEREENEVTVIKAPDSIVGVYNGVFLAGSIEMGKAIDWQTELTNKCKGLNITILNPRRDDWNSSWKQTIKNDKFRTQVEWELNALESAEKIVVYFDPKTQSPITLMELGLFAKTGKVCVCCPDGYFRRGNVEIVCKKYGVPMVNNIDGLVKFIK